MIESAKIGLERSLMRPTFHCDDSQTALLHQHLAVGVDFG
jgi:hypothetical protein